MKRLYAQEDFAQERISWKAIIQLNLIRHVLTILKVLEEEATARPPSSTSLLLDIHPHPDPGPSAQPAPRLSNLNLATTNSSSTQTAFHHTLRLRLAPLAEIEANLSKQLTQCSLPPVPSKEPIVHSYTAWMKHFGYRSATPSASSSQAASPVSAGPVGLHFEEEAGRVIDSLKGDIAALWNDPVVRAVLQARKVRLELEGGFFLDDSDRVCALNYEPNDCKCLGAPFRYPLPIPLGHFGSPTC
jgi:hypothetical protein